MMNPTRFRFRMTSYMIDRELCSKEKCCNYCGVEVSLIFLDSYCVPTISLAVLFLVQSTSSSKIVVSMGVTSGIEGLSEVVGDLTLIHCD